MKSRLWLALGVVLGMLCGLPVIRAQVQPGRPRFPGILVISSGKTATINNTLTFAGTDGTTLTFPATSATLARTDAGQTFIGTQTFSGRIALGNAYLDSSTIYSAGSILWSGNGSASGGADGTYVYTSALSLTPIGTFGTATVITYDAPGTLAQRNGTAAQTFNLGNTVTTVATAGEWWKLDWQGTANQFRMGAVAGSSSGTNRAASWDFGNKLASATAAITVPATSGPIVMGGLLQAPYLQGTTIYSAAGTPLPTCNGGAEGSRAAVSDATLPTFLAAYTSGGAVHASVYCDGTSWKTD